MTCSVDGCRRKEFAAKLCRSHWRRQRKGEPIDVDVRPWGQSPRAAVWEVVLDLLEIPSSEYEAIERAKERFWKAAERWASAKAKRWKLKLKR